MRFTESHEWIKLDESGIGIVGVTVYAQKELGDVVYVELPVVGRQVKAGQEAVVLESTKAAADVYSPVTGTIIEVNSAVSQTPELVNQQAEGDGWLFKIRLDNSDELNQLMNDETYEAMLRGL